MTYTDEMISKAKTAASAAELQAIAKEYNIELSDSEAAEYFNFLNGCNNKNGMRELSDLELQMVAGGMGGEKKDPNPKYHAFQTVWIGFPTSQSFLKAFIIQPEFYHKDFNSWRYLVLKETGLYEEYYLDSHQYIQITDPQGVWPY